MFDRQFSHFICERKSHGFTLVEVMVSVLVLSMGLLGFASLQVYGMKNTHSAYLRTQATALAYEITDRMRANPSAITAGTYNLASPTRKAECTQTSGCNPTELAQNDIFEWGNTVSGNLPSGQGVVCLDSTPKDGTPLGSQCDSSGTVYVIKIWWQDVKNTASESDAGDFQLFTTEFQPS